MWFLDPTGARVDVKAPAAGNERVLSGKTVALLSNRWPSYETMIARFGERLRQQQTVANVIYYEIPRTRAAPDALFDKVVAECDFAIVGLGN